MNLYFDPSKPYKGHTTPRARLDAFRRDHPELFGTKPATRSVKLAGNASLRECVAAARNLGCEGVELRSVAAAMYRTRTGSGRETASIKI